MCVSDRDSKGSVSTEEQSRVVKNNFSFSLSQPKNSTDPQNIGGDDSDWSVMAFCSQLFLMTYE